MNSPIPETKQDAVTRGLQEAFGVSQIDDIRAMTGGRSKALVFRIVVQERPYLLRVIPDTDANLGPGQGDQTHHFVCMKLAAEAGIGPKVWHTNAAEGISITDFVESQPLPQIKALTLLPDALRKLHALPPFPSPRVVNYLDAMDKMVRRLQAANILPKSVSAELFKLYGQVISAYPRDGSDMVPCHNDMRPENILFDGTRPWLIDWEAAFLNDRYLDLAVVANFIVTNSAEEATYLHTYFGKAPSAYQRARFYLMKQLLHLFYPAFLTLFSCKGKSMDSITTAPDFRDFHNRLWACEIDLSDDQNKLDYAKVHLNQALHDGRTAQFQEALRIVSHPELAAR